jgi:hypothetical protein
VCWLVGQQIKVSKRKRQQSQAHAHGGDCVNVTVKKCFHGVAFVLGLHRAALPQLSGYAQKIMLGKTLSFDNKNPRGKKYS